MPCVLTINAGSSSIRFGVHEAGKTPRRQLDGTIERIAAEPGRLDAVGAKGRVILAHPLIHWTRSTQDMPEIRDGTW
jgi:acetate kinase